MELTESLQICTYRVSCAYRTSSSMTTFVQSIVGAMTLYQLALGRLCPVNRTGSHFGAILNSEVALSLEDKNSLEKEMATHSSVLAWRIPGTGEPGGLLSLGSHRGGHDWRNSFEELMNEFVLEKLSLGQSSLCFLSYSQALIPRACSHIWQMADHPGEVTCHSINHISADIEASSFFSTGISSSFLCMNISHMVRWGLSPCGGKTDPSNLLARSFFLVERSWKGSEAFIASS